MTYPQTLDYLFARLPMYQRIGSAAYKADLVNILKITDYLGKPHLKLKCIHVAGTNGKGSSSHMLAAVLQQCGYKAGLYTSPHLTDFRERVKVNGKMIPKNYVVDFVQKHKEVFEAIEPSFFEWTVGLALDYFAAEEVDVAIIEVGLGGRLDSTNIITPKTSLITNISMDHMVFLGDTLEKISREKAGIIKPRVPVVVSQYQSESAPVFNAKAKELKARIEYADKNFKIISSKKTKSHLLVSVLNKKTEKADNYELDLTGHYQAKNLLGVLNVLDFVSEAGFILETENVKKALANVCAITGLRGRWQTLNDKPLIIADTGHNEEGIKQVVENLQNIEHGRLHMVIGVVNDKDISGIMTLLPKKAIYYFVKANIPRALDSKELQLLAKKHNLSGTAYDTVEKGLKAAKKDCQKTDIIFVGGSTFVVADALLLFEGK